MAEKVYGRNEINQLVKKYKSEGEQSKIFPRYLVGHVVGMDIKYIAANSNGKDSLFMILELIRRNYPLDLVLFFDTGKEYLAIYETWERLKRILDKHGIAYDTISAKESFDYYFSEKTIQCKDGTAKQGYSWCGGVCRWMTAFKTDCMNRYYKEHFSEDTIVFEYVGIAMDELKRVKPPASKGRFFKRYPLIEWGYSENDCFAGCYKAGFDWKEPDTDVALYQILDHVNCWCCGNKNLQELRNMYLFLPKYWEKLKQMQDKTFLPLKEYGDVYSLEKRFLKETENVDPEDYLLPF